MSARGVKPSFAMPVGSNRGMTAGKMNGGDDGARTRDLCRDSPPLWRNSLKPGVMDGNLIRPKEPFGTVIVPLMCPRSIFGDLCPTPFFEAIPGRFFD